MPTLPDVHMRGTRAQQPAATAVSVAALYFVTDENKCERSNGTAWESYSAVAAFADDAGMGDDAVLTPTLHERVEALEKTVQELIDPTGRSAKRKK
jgi:hypothetical protein